MGILDDALKAITGGNNNGGFTPNSLNFTQQGGNNFLSSPMQNPPTSILSDLAGTDATTVQLNNPDVISQINSAAGVGAGPDSGFTLKDGLGLGIAGVQGLGSLWAAWNGMQQLDHAKDTFDFQKSAYNRNLANQAQTINTRLEDRQRARIGSTGDNNAAGNYESLGTYLKKNKVNGSAIK